MTFRATISDVKDRNVEPVTTRMPFLPSVGNTIIVDGFCIKVKDVLIDYDSLDVTIKGVFQ